MMTQKEIDRINELARKSKTEDGLTSAEKEEQAALRQAYVAAMRASLRGKLENTVVEYPDGTKIRLSDMKKRK